MQWHSEGIVISAKPHGEGHAILGAFTEEYGYHKGYVFGGSGVRKRPLLELGNLIDLKWSSRFEDQLGTFSVELVENYAAVFFHDAERLTALNSMAQILYLLPEREPHPRLYQQTLVMMDLLRRRKAWYIPFIIWELSFLEAIGFGLSLEACVISKQTEDLAYVSPNTGHVVTQKVGAQYADKLLTLPPFLGNPDQVISFDAATNKDILNGLKLSGFFLEKTLKEYFCTGLPEVRMRLIGMITDKLENR